MKQDAGVAGNGLLWVTLFLILLSFFIFLNVLARPDAGRQDQIRRSVRAGFGALEEMGSRTPGVWRHRFDDTGVMELTDLVSRTGPQGAVSMEEGGRLWLRLPLTALFTGDSPSLSPEGAGILTAMKPHLTALASGGRVMVHQPRSPEAGDGLALSTRRAFAVARMLGPGVQAWGLGDLFPEFHHGPGRAAQNGRVVLVFSGPASGTGGSIGFRDFLFRIFRETPWED